MQELEGTFLRRGGGGGGKEVDLEFTLLHQEISGRVHTVQLGGGGGLNDYWECNKRGVS